MNRSNASLQIAAVLYFAATSCLLAEVKLPALFGDHMVLQEGMKLPVWGTAAPGEVVTVTVGKETGHTQAGADGKWRIDLPPLPVNAVPTTLTVAGTNSLSCSDVLVGEVWLCAGQSNMGFSLAGGKSFGGADGGVAEAAQAHDPQLRLFHLPRNHTPVPQTDVQAKWEVCAPDSATVFSAVGYFFGRELRQDLHQPVGLIQAAVGGTPAEAWTSLSGLEKEPLLKPYVEISNQIRAHFAQATADQPAADAAFRAKSLQWRQTDDGKAYTERFKAWRAASAQASAAGILAPPWPRPPRSAPQPPPPVDGGPTAPTNLYNGMIAPLIPFAIKGGIWYQGESNADEAKAYRMILGNMIGDWREKWGEGDFPFIFVQVAGFKGSPIQKIPVLRESQLKTLELPNTAMATAVDIGDPKNIHPLDKKDVGHRVALAARRLAYGEKIVASGPVYAGIQVHGNGIHVTFTEEGSGLIIGSAPWVPLGEKPIPTDKLYGFAVAGEDRKWFPADAEIQGNEVVVSSRRVSMPVAVRYDWDNAPRGNLYNRENLPASPFRSDDWPEPAADGKIQSVADSGAAAGK